MAMARTTTNGRARTDPAAASTGPTAAPVTPEATTRRPARMREVSLPTENTARATPGGRTIRAPVLPEPRAAARTCTEAGTRAPCGAAAIGRGARATPTTRRARPRASRGAAAETSTPGATATCTATPAAPGRNTTAEAGTTCRGRARVRRTSRRPGRRRSTEAPTMGSIAMRALGRAGTSARATTAITSAAAEHPQAATARAEAGALTAVVAVAAAAAAVAGDSYFQPTTWYPRSVRHMST